MSSISMTQAEREEFLADLHIGVLAVARVGDPPLVTPIWYRYTPGGVVEFNTETAAQKTQLLETRGKASLCVQREELPYAYVTVEGPVRLADATTDVRLDIASRYLGPEAAASYIETSVDDITVTLSPERWYTVDFAKLGS